MAEEAFAAAVREGPEAYHKLRMRCQVAALDAAIMYDAGMASFIAGEMHFDLLCAYVTECIEDDERSLAPEWDAVFDRLLSNEYEREKSTGHNMNCSVVPKLVTSALQHGRWRLLRHLILSASLAFGDVDFLDSCLHMDMSPDDLNWIYAVLVRTGAFAQGTPVLIRAPTAEHVFALMERHPAHWMMINLAELGITNAVRITNGRFRRAVERVYAMIGCYVEGLVTTRNVALLHFLTLVGALPIDLQQVVANRVYGCSRNIVALLCSGTRSYEPVHWVLKLGPKYED
jgi:hypothetical protein